MQREGGLGGGTTLQWLSRAERLESPRMEKGQVKNSSEGLQDLDLGSWEFIERRQSTG